jgi:hypothetical protein
MEAQMSDKPDKDDKFEFEIEENQPGTPAKAEIEVEDDTPSEDRNRTPLPKHIVEELEADELEDYSDKVKIRLKQMKKVWHDERREKERALREQHEALNVTQRLFDENRRLKTTLSQGERTLIDTYRTAAGLEYAAAKRAYKEAYEAGDSEKVVDAQSMLASATNKLQQVQDYRPTLQEQENYVQPTPAAVQRPTLDTKTTAWQERNTWYGKDEEMTSAALGLHLKLEKQYGKEFVGTDKYWQAVDETIRRRFPEYYGEQETQGAGAGKAATRTETRPATVVAPESISTSSL